MPKRASALAKVSGFRKSRKVPLLESAPRLQPLAKPLFPLLEQKIN